MSVEKQIETATKDLNLNWGKEDPEIIILGTLDFVKLLDELSRETNMINLSNLIMKMEYKGVRVLMSGKTEEVLVF